MCLRAVPTDRRDIVRRKCDPSHGRCFRCLGALRKSYYHRQCWMLGRPQQSCECWAKLRKRGFGRAGHDNKRSFCMKSKRSASFPVIILTYHAVVRTPLEVFDWCFITESKFEAQLDYLMRTFDIVPLAAVPRLLRTGPTRTTAVITFDDGFLNNFEVALPILRRASVPAAVFIC